MTAQTVAVFDPNRNHAEFLLRTIARTGRRAVWTRTAREALDSGAALVVARLSALGTSSAMLHFIAGALMRGTCTIAVTADRPAAPGVEALALGAVAVVPGWWNAEAVARAIDEYFAHSATPAAD